MFELFINLFIQFKHLALAFYTGLQQGGIDNLVSLGTSSNPSSLVKRREAQSFKEGVPMVSCKSEPNAPITMVPKNSKFRL